VTPPLPPYVAEQEPGQPPGGLHFEVRMLQAALPLVGGLDVLGVEHAVSGLLGLASHVPTDEPSASSLLTWLEGHLG